MTAASPRSFTTGGATPPRPGGGEVGRQPVDGVGGCGLVARTGQVDGHQERAVGAGPKPSLTRS